MIYQNRLKKLFPDLNFTVATKADVCFPVVGAASIMAKVTRDYELAMWPHRNPGVVLEGSFGTGYPSDPLTVRWMRNNVKRVEGFPPTLVRFSWISTQRILADHAAKVSW